MTKVTGQASFKLSLNWGNIASILLLQEVWDSLIASQLFVFIHCYCCNQTILIINPLLTTWTRCHKFRCGKVLCASALSLHLGCSALTHGLLKAFKHSSKNISDEFEHHKYVTNLCTSLGTLSFSSRNAGQNTADKTMAVNGIVSDFQEKKRKRKKDNNNNK